MSVYEERLFNRYCADETKTEVYLYKPAYEDTEQLYVEGGSVKYHPHDNMEQLAVVVLELTIKWLCSPHKVGSPKAMVADQVMEAHEYMCTTMRTGGDIKEAFREFVWDVMGAYSK